MAAHYRGKRSMVDRLCCRRRLLEAFVFLIASGLSLLFTLRKPSIDPQFAARKEKSFLSSTMGIRARYFDVYNHSLPCDVFVSNWTERKTLNQPTKDGLFFLKPYKVGSSTASGVHLRLARNLAMRRWNETFRDVAVANHTRYICKARFGHGKTMSPASFLFHNRSKTQSFLWTILRDPTKRAASEFFHFQVSRERTPPTDNNFRQHVLSSKRTTDYYLRALSLTPGFRRTRHDPIQTANAILAEYDFIAVTERMDESLVVLSMLLRTPLSDLLYLSAKTNGHYDAFHPCTYITPKFISPAMHAFFQSDAWRERIQYDLALYQAVNRSLDLTIERLGQDAFEQRLFVFRAMQRMATEVCLPSAVFPCDSKGVFHPESNCMWKDSGCGMDCLDRVAAQFQNQ